MRALPVALMLMDEGRARKRGRGLSSRLTDQASGLLGRDAVMTVIRLQDAGKLPDCGAHVWEQVTGLAGAGDAGIGAVILSRDHKYACEGRSVRRIGEDPAAALDLVGETRVRWLMESED